MLSTAAPGASPTSARTATTWFFLDVVGAELVILPERAGAVGHARIVLVDAASGAVLKTVEGPAAATTSVAMAEHPRLSDVGLRLFQRDGARWSEIAKVKQITQSGDEEVHVIDPRLWGIQEDCVVSVRDVQRRINLIRELVPAHTALTRILRFPDGRKLQLDFHEPGARPGNVGKRMLPPLRLVPLAQRGAPDPAAVKVSGRLAVSVRRDVTVAPLRLSSAGRGGLATNGLIGAWEGGNPVLEAMEYVLGRQRYQFDAPPSELPPLDDRVVIYAGSPHASWGHFLTQGLSRLWFALQRPDVPLLWDASRLEPYQQRVLDALGITNQSLFLRHTSRFAEVLFPYPGLAIGDFVEPEFGRAIGRIRPAQVVPGKRLFVTRARLGTTRGTQNSGQAHHLESILGSYGFEAFAPEEHPLEVQLEELTSAETVIGVEGSAFHTLLLVQGQIETRFWAFTRHRAGGGVFQHIKDAKRLRYETLNFVRSASDGARGSLDLDLEALDDALRATDGLTSNLSALDPHLEQPFTHQTSFSAHLSNTQVTMTGTELDMSVAAHLVRADAASHAKQIEKLIASYV